MHPINSKISSKRHRFSKWRLMKKALVAILTLFILLLSQVAVAANKSVPPSTPSGPTKMATVLSWFDQGQNVTWAELKGSYSGRCFGVTEQDKPYQALLTYMPVANSDGPGFPHGSPLLFNVRFIHWGENMDELSEKRLNEFKTELRNYWSKIYSTLTENPTVTELYGDEPDGTPKSRDNHKVEFKKFNEYFISKTTILISGRSIGGRPLKPGDVLKACYFFKRVGD